MISLTDPYSIGYPIAFAILQIISQSSLDFPGGSRALLTFCTLLSVFVKVPSFSAKLVEGSTISANSAVSVRKISCTAINSSFFSASATCIWSGSLSIGFSPMIYNALSSPLIALSIISVTVRPFTGGRVLPHASSNFFLISSSSTY